MDSKNEPLSLPVFFSWLGFGFPEQFSDDVEANWPAFA